MAGRIIIVNGVRYQIRASKTRVLLDVLREDLGLTGTKRGCDTGVCGACTVVVGDRPVRACRCTMDDVAFEEIITVEGLAEAGVLHPLQEAFIASGAVQCGFCTPGMIMTAYALIKRHPEPGREEIRRALQGNLCRCTGYEPIENAVILAASLNLKDLKKGCATGVGASPPRLGGRDKVTGAARYTADYHIPGCLFGAAVWSPVPSGMLNDMDLSAARKLPGVLAILTAADVPGLNRIGRWQQDRPVLVDRKIRFTGDVLALVVGTSDRIAREGAAAVKCDITPLPGLFSVDEAVSRKDSDLFPSGYLAAEITIRKPGPVHSETQSVKTVFETPFIEHAVMEPETALAYFKGEVLTIVAPSQNVYFDRFELQRILGLSPRESHRIRVIQAVTGGAFGKREDMVVQPLAVVAAWHLKQPVKVMFNREESFRSTSKRHPTRIRHISELDNSGKIVHQDVEILADTGAYASWAPNILRKSAVHATGPYRVPSVHIHGKSVHTQSAFSGAMRGFGATQSIMAAECHLDHIAKIRGEDPLAYRLKRGLKSGDTTATGQVLPETSGLPGVLEAAADRFNWSGQTHGAVTENGEYVGFGVAGGFYGIGYGNAIQDRGQATVTIDRDGFLTLFTSAVDYGQGSDTVFAQIIQETLGVPWRLIKVVTGDTGQTPDSGSTVASRQTFVTGKAVEKICRDMRDAMMPAAESALSVSRNHITVNQAGWITNDDRDLSWTELVSCAAKMDIPLKKKGRYLNRTACLDKSGQGDIYRTYAFAAACAEVRVNRTTGKIRLCRIVSAHNSGKIINPVMARGQVTGGVIMAAGMVLMENYRVENGIPACRDFDSYIIPRFRDIPEIDVVFIEENDPDGPYGARGLGEPAMLAAGPAIVNAVSDATDRFFNTIPLTPDTIKMV